MGDTLSHTFRGTAPPEAGTMGSFPPHTMAHFPPHAFLRHTPSRSWNDGELPMAYAYASGALSGIPEAIAFSPFQVIKVPKTRR